MADFIDTPAKLKSTYINAPEAIGVFDSYEVLQAAYYDLRMVGFSRFDISVLASQEVITQKLGTSYWRATDLDNNPDAPRAAFVSEEAIGELEGAIFGGSLFIGSAIAMAALRTPANTIAASIGAIAIGGSPASVIGALFARRGGQTHTSYYANQIDHGAILLWVRLHDKDREDQAIKIMKAHSGRVVHVHAWRQ